MEAKTRLEPQLKEARQAATASQAENQRRDELDREEKRSGTRSRRKSRCETRSLGWLAAFMPGSTTERCWSVIGWWSRRREKMTFSPRRRSSRSSFPLSLCNSRMANESTKPTRCNPRSSHFDARGVYQKIGFTGALGTRLNEDLASSEIAAAMRSRGETGKSAAHYRQAARRNSKSQRAKEGLECLAAEQLYADALKMGKTTPGGRFKASRGHGNHLYDIATVQAREGSAVAAVVVKNRQGALWTRRRFESSGWTCWKSASSSAPSPCSPRRCAARPAITARDAGRALPRGAGRARARGHRLSTPAPRACCAATTCCPPWPPASWRWSSTPTSGG